jgi:hypothetical protein
LRDVIQRINVYYYIYYLPTFKYKISNFILYLLLNYKCIIYPLLKTKILVMKILYIKMIPPTATLRSPEYFGFKDKIKNKAGLRTPQSRRNFPDFSGVRHYTKKNRILITIKYVKNTIVYIDNKINSGVRQKIYPVNKDLSIALRNKLLVILTTTQHGVH